MISPQHEQGLAMLGPAHSLTGSSLGSRPDVSNPRTRSRTCASSKTFPPELLSTPPKAGTGIGSPSVGEACRVVKVRLRPGRGAKAADSVAARGEAGRPRRARTYADLRMVWWLSGQLRELSGRLDIDRWVGAGATLGDVSLL